VEYLDKALPLDGKALRLRFLIEDMARSVGVAIGDVNVLSKGDAIAGDKKLLANPYAAARSLQKMTASVFVTGTFSQLQFFLHNIENSGRLMDINDLAIEPGSEGNLNLKLGLSAYYLAPK
jgi:Tfp pilus assembly protein PilO